MNTKEIASSLTGIPFKLGGRDEAGLDCLGLVWFFYWLNGINFPESDGADYGLDWARNDPDRYLRGLLDQGTQATGKLKPLDLVYFRFDGAVTHAGIMVDSERFIHVMKDSMVCITPLQSHWQKRLAGARRLI